MCVCVCIDIFYICILYPVTSAISSLLFKSSLSMLLSKTSKCNRTGLHVDHHLTQRGPFQGVFSVFLSRHAICQHPKIIEFLLHAACMTWWCTVPTVLQLAIIPASYKSYTRTYHRICKCMGAAWKTAKLEYITLCSSSYFSHKPNMHENNCSKKSKVRFALKT